MVSSSCLPRFRVFFLYPLTSWVFLLKGVVTLVQAYAGLIQYVQYSDQSWPDLGGQNEYVWASPPDRLPDERSNVM
jgi:hypothetical protein